jgi:hypothetical protein
MSSKRACVFYIIYEITLLFIDNSTHWGELWTSLGFRLPLLVRVYCHALRAAWLTSA